MLAWLAQSLATRQEEKVSIIRRDHHFLPVYFLFQYFREADPRGDAERFAERAAAEVAVDQKSPGAGKRHRDREVRRDRGFPFVRDRTGDEHRLRPRTFVRHEENRRANVAIRLREDVARVVRLQESHATLGLFLRNLAKHVFGEMMLEFAERRHALVDPVEQKANADASQGTDAEADDQAR